MTEFEEWEQAQMIEEQAQMTDQAFAKLLDALDRLFEAPSPKLIKIIARCPAGRKPKG